MPSRPIGTHGWTAEMLETLPNDGNRYEIIDGELIVSPSPSLLHQRAVRLLTMLLVPYVEERRRAELFFAPADVVFGQRDVVEPDIFVVPPVDAAARRWVELEKPFLAVEVLSPSSEENDRGRKLRLYRQKRVSEYWIIDCESRLVERWRPADDQPEILRDTLAWNPFEESAPLVIDLVTFFARVQGEV